MKKKAIRFAQARLNARGPDAGPEDGLLGPRTLEALIHSNERTTVFAAPFKRRGAEGFLCNALRGLSSYARCDAA